MAEYTPEFYEQLATASLRSAERVVPIIVDLLRPSSVVDVGCGVGGWLAAFRALGVRDIVGLDGPSVPRDRLQFPRERFVVCDLTRPLPLRKRFDLVVCLEVAEHLPRECGMILVESLTRLGPTVLFSAAIPYQRGTGHINERWQDEWVQAFAHHGFQVADVVRPRIWAMADVEPWYRQNMLLFFDQRYLCLRPHSEPSHPPLRLVHPDLWVRMNERPPTIREWTGLASPVLRQSARYRLAMLRRRVWSSVRRS